MSALIAAMGRSRKLALGSAGLGVAMCICLVAILVVEGAGQASLWASVLGLPVGVVGAVAGMWALAVRPNKVLPPPALGVPEWVVDRPAEVAEVVAALLENPDATVGITTGLHGAGGFGKTVLARVVCADQRVRHRFSGGIFMVTMGRDVRSAPAVAAKVNDVIRLMAGEDAGFTDPEIASQRLGALLDSGPRRLLVLDDVWEPTQLDPFTAGGRRCARLVTTRVPELLAGRGLAVRVDQMSPEQARSVLTSGLPPLDPEVAEGLLIITGRWPLLLRLANKILANSALAGADVPAAAAQLLQRLRDGGPAVVDDITGESRRTLDVSKPPDRTLAVRATIEASTSLLDAPDAQRFAELGVFAEHETIPFSLIARLWRATGSLDELRASQLCARLAELALVSPAGTGTSGVVLHDVVRDFLRGELGRDGLARLNGLLVDAVAGSLPPAQALAGGTPGYSGIAWWELGPAERYMRDHLIEHLIEADRRLDAERVASDLRWAAVRLQESGPAAPAADLSLVSTPLATRLQAAVTRAAHLLAPTEPARARVDVLHSRVADDPDWGPQVTALRDLRAKPRLVTRWPLPDLAPSLRRVLNGHRGMVHSVAVAPDGSWLATGGDDGTARIWDAASGEQRTILTGHDGPVRAVAIAPDGSWLVTGGDDGTARIWDAASGEQRTALTGHTNWVTAVAVAPGGTWIATGSRDGTTRIWDAASHEQRALLTDPSGWARSVAIAPDGRWIATGGEDGKVRITGHRRVVLTGHDGPVRAVAIAPDGSWLATGSADRTARIWDATSGQQRAALTGHSAWVNGVLVAPDGSWLATGSNDSTARIWDAATGEERAVLTGHLAAVNAVAVAPDGSWLVSGSWDWTARIWDTAARQRRIIQAGHDSTMSAVAVEPNSSWLVTGSEDGTARIWDAASGAQRTALTGHDGPVRAVAVAPDGSWLVTGSEDGTARIWDAASGAQRTALTGHDGPVRAVAVAPDGSWLVTGEDDAEWHARIWDAATGKQRRALPEIGWVKAVAVAPDGSWLVTGGDDGTARVWDAVTGQQRGAVTGHGGPVLAVAIAPDGSWVASAAIDGTARIWDAVTGEQLAVLTGHRRWVDAMAVSPDGGSIATVSIDHTARIWDVVTGQVQALMRVEDSLLGCAWLGGSGLVVVGKAGLYLFDFLTA